MKRFLRAPGVLLNVEHISSIQLQPSGLLEITLLNGKTFLLEQSFDSVIDEIAKAYQGVVHG